MSEIQLFNNGEFELRVLQRGDSFTVEAPGLARALGFHEARDMLRTLPEGEKGSEIAPTLGGYQRIGYVTESGFYRAIGRRYPARIKDPEIRAGVERFQDWVYGEVLPDIRRTGGYAARPVQLGIDTAPPDVYTYPEVCALLRQHFGVNLGVVELTRNLRAGGVLRQDGAPTAKYRLLFHFTGSAWCIHRFAIQQIAYRVYQTGRELQDFRFLQLRFELEGVGRELSAIEQDLDRAA